MMSPNTALGAGFFLTELQQSRISLVQTNGQNLRKKNTNTAHKDLFRQNCQYFNKNFKMKEEFKIVWEAGCHLAWENVTGFLQISHQV